MARHVDPRASFLAGCAVAACFCVPACGSASGPPQRSGTGGVSQSGGQGTGGSAAGTGGAASGEDDGYDVVIDPYGPTPLAAVVNLHGVAANDVQAMTVVVVGQQGGSDFTKRYLASDRELTDNLGTSSVAFPSAGYHVPEYGLYADRSSDVRIHVQRIAHDPVDLALQIAAPLSKPDEDVWVPKLTINTALPQQMA